MIRIIKESYDYVFHDLVDHRSDNLFLMGSPWPSVVIVGVYLCFVKIGPHFMKNRPPYKLDSIIFVYNIFQIISSAYLVKQALHYAWGGTYKVFCEPVDYTTNPDSIVVMKCMWFYYLLKIIDLLDTVFFILRKKQSQVTFLHLFHHSGMVLVSWLWARYIPGGHGSLSGSLNCFIHVWMYSYYLITNTWPEYKKQLWWKKYLTIMQMVQFCIIIAHLLPVFFMSNCPFPKFPCLLLLVQNVAFLKLFYNFYQKAYTPRKSA